MTITDQQPSSQQGIVAQGVAGAGCSPDDAQRGVDAQKLRGVVGTPLPDEARFAAKPIPPAPCSASSSASDQRWLDAHMRRAAGGDSPDDAQIRLDAQKPCGVVGTLVPDQTITGAKPGYAPSGPERYDVLRLTAVTFTQIQEARIAVNNRLGAALRSGSSWEDGLTPNSELLEAAEAMWAKAMAKAFKRAEPELYAWAQDTIGVGVHTTARLIGCIGDPLIGVPGRWVDNTTNAKVNGKVPKRVLVFGEPFERNVAKLWAYCGHGDATRRPFTGMSQEQAFTLGNPRAKMLVHLMATKCSMNKGPRELWLWTPGKDVDAETSASADSSASASRVDDRGDDDETLVVAETRPDRVSRRSPYRDLYDQARLDYSGRDWSDGHKHNAALRRVGKEILKDLWLVAKKARG